MKKKNIIIILTIAVLIIIGLWLILKDSSLPQEEQFVPEQPSADQIEPVEISQELIDLLSRTENITNMSYDLNISSHDESYDIKFWQKENLFKMEMAFEGETVIFITDPNQQLAYQYLPAHNIAMELNLEETKEMLKEGSLKDQALSLVQYNPVIQGRDTYDNKECTIVEYTVEEEKITMWIWEEYGLPIKTESVMNGFLMTAEVTNIDFTPAEDDIFELPAGVEITDMPIF